MADEPNEGAEGVSDEEDALELKPEDQVDEQDDQPDPYAPLAQKMGWVPKEDFKGPAEAWKPAEQFILDGDEIKKSHARELRDIRATLDTVSKTSAAILAEKLDEQREKLTAEYNQKVDDGDAAGAFKVGEKLMSLKEQEPRKGPAPEAVEWAERHKWFNSDPLATRLAMNVANDLAHLPVKQQLDAAEAEVKRVYPHLFSQGKPPPGVASPQSRTATPQKRDKGFAEMPRASQEIAKDMVERKILPSVDAFAKHYWANEGKTQ